VRIDISFFVKNRKALSMVVVHVASDAFVGTVPQVVTVNVNLIVVCCNLFRCNGFCVLTRYHYCGDHSYCDR